MCVRESVTEIVCERECEVDVCALEIERVKQIRM